MALSLGGGIGGVGDGDCPCRCFDLLRDKATGASGAGVSSTAMLTARIIL